MAGIRLKIHPLFFAFGLYYAVTGRIFMFIIYTLTAVIHELGHSFVANSFGYRLNKICLMPFGAVISGNTEGLSFKDEIKIALAGPFINLAIGLFFVALWWIYPECYAFTDVAAIANFSVALVNFLPVYPLDGGRILSAALSLKIKREKALLICKILGGAVGTALLALFIISIFYQINISLLFFSAFILFGAIDRKKENIYVKMQFTLSTDKLKHGVPCCKIAVDKSVTVKSLIRLLNVNAINEVDVYDNQTVLAHLTQSKINDIMLSYPTQTPLSQIIFDIKDKQKIQHIV